GGFEFPEPDRDELGIHVAERALDLGEPPLAAEQAVNDVKRPLIADELQRACYFAHVSYSLCSYLLLASEGRTVEKGRVRKSRKVARLSRWVCPKGQGVS